MSSTYMAVRDQEQSDVQSLGPAEWKLSDMSGGPSSTRDLLSKEDSLGKYKTSITYKSAESSARSKLPSIFRKVIPKSWRKSQGNNKLEAKGWRKGIHYCIILALICFLINLTLLIVAASHSSSLTEIGTLYEGSCSKVARINSVAHVFINILSTALLGASNYVMQILGAPTREQVDVAHAKGKSLDIGIPSTRNLARVGWKRVVLFLGLWGSSFPLHFFWNSVVFSTLQSNEFIAVTVANDFLSRPFTCSAEYMSWKDTDSFQRIGSVPCSAAETFYEGAKVSGVWDRLENKECMDKYSASFLSGRSNLLLVSNTTEAEFASGYNANSSTFGAFNSTSWNQRVGLDWSGDGWLCKYAGQDYLKKILGPGESCSTSAMISHAQDWQVELTNGTFPVQYCLSEVVPEQCRLQSLLVILLGVTCMNLCKLLCMVLGALVLTDRPLMVLGDAAASFLRYADETTNGRCLWTGMHFQKSTWRRLAESFGKRKRREGPEPEVWNARRYRWIRAAPSSNWFWYWICSLVSIFVLTAGTAASMSSMGSSAMNAAFAAQIGTAVSATTTELLSGVSTANADFITLINAAMATNAPQVLFVFFYYMSNRLLTCMVSADEWSRFAFRRRTQRVSYPTDAQRSTYWLQLPYRYSVPLLIIATLTHFFISESLFVTRVWIYDWQGNINAENGYAFGDGGPLNSAMGYNAKAIYTSLGFMTMILLVVTGLGFFKKYAIGPPLVRNSSLAISAACHPPEGDEDAAVQPLMWGATSHEVDGRPGHCTFTSLEVEMPVVGNMYAGKEVSRN